MVDRSLSEFADRISQLMREIARAFTKKQKNELFKGTLTLPQFLILDIIHKEGQARMTDIAHALEVSTAAATGIVDRLVKYGYVQRVFDSADRRIIKIKLKSKGKEVVEKLEEQRRQQIIEVFGQISEKERSDYLKILTRVKEILTRQEAKKD
jgi:DNA-binding MarR family transcriptional regulator